MIEDAELLRRYAEENAEPAFAELVRRHLDLVYSVALRRLGGDAHAAADVTQQVFTALARQAGPLARGVVLPAWLYNTTRNLAVDYIRAERRRRAREQEAHLMQQLDPDSSAADWERLRPLLDAAMDDLGERDREAVVLRYFASRPFAEIGRALRLSEDGARMRVDRALEKLRVLLARRGVASTAAALSLVLAQQSVLAAPMGMAVSVTGAAVAATASAGNASGPVLAFMGFMNSSKITVGAVGLLVAIACGGAYREVRAQHAAEQAVTAGEAERSALQARLRDLEGRAGEAEQAARKKADASTRPPATSGTPTIAQLLDRSTADQTFMTRHPAVHALLVTQMRAEAAGRYAPLIKLMRLSPEEINRFTELHVMGRAGITTGSDGARIAYDTGGTRQEAEAKMREFLGEERFDRYKAFERKGRGEWQWTIDLASNLALTSEPLRPEQGDQLWQILMEKRGSVPWSPSPQYDWDAIGAEARRVLTPAQLGVFEKLQVGDYFSQARARTFYHENNAGKNASVPSPK